MKVRVIQVFLGFLAAVAVWSIVLASLPALSEALTSGDVPQDQPYYGHMEALNQNGCAAGYSPDPHMDCPQPVLNPAGSAAFVERAVHDAEHPGQADQAGFANEALSRWDARWGNGFWEDSCRPDTSSESSVFCPNRNITRADGCVFFLRMVYGTDYRPLPGPGYFQDVDPSAWYADWVDACWEAGIAEPCATGPLMFCPEAGLTRAAAAAMLVRVREIPRIPTDPAPTRTPFSPSTSTPAITWTSPPPSSPTPTSPPPTIVPPASPTPTSPSTIVPPTSPPPTIMPLTPVPPTPVLPTLVPTIPVPSSPYSTFADGMAPSRILWVSNRGSSGGDGSYHNPYATLAQAQHAAPGTEIRVEGRISGKNFLTLNGTASAPIWIRGEPGAVIDGLFLLKSSNHVIIEDLEFTGSHDHQLHIQDSHYILMQGLDIHHPARYCLKVYHGSHIYLFHSSLHDAETNTTWIGTHNGRILGNHMSNAAKNMLVLKSGSQDIFVAFNEFENQVNSTAGPIQLGNATGAEHFNPLNADYEGLRLVLFANMIHGVTATPVSFMGCRDCAAIHNTIYDVRLIQDAPLVRFLPGWAGQSAGVSESVTDGCRFSGNIVVGGTEGSSTLSTHSQGVGSNNRADYNGFFKPGAVNWRGLIPQDLAHSTYDQDPRLDGRGIPQNHSLVHAQGPADLSGLPFSQYFIMDFYGNPFSQPFDIGSAAGGG